MLKAIIFDFDGVLMNSKSLILEILKDYKSNITLDEIKEIFNGNVYQNELMKNIFENHQEEFKRKFIEKTTKKHFYEFAEKLIDDLSEKFKLFIVSGAQTNNLKSHLNLIDRVEKFTEILGADEILSKVERFKIIFEKYNLNIHECLFITDTLGDIKEANEVNLKSIGVTWGIHDVEILQNGNPHKIVQRVEELEEEIELLN